METVELTKRFEKHIDIECSNFENPVFVSRNMLISVL